MELHDIARDAPSNFTDDHVQKLNNIDTQLTEILLAGERT
jgi:hypothetical protein